MPQASKRKIQVAQIHRDQTSGQYKENRQTIVIRPPEWRAAELTNLRARQANQAETISSLQHQTQQQQQQIKELTASKRQLERQTEELKVKNKELAASNTAHRSQYSLLCTDMKQLEHKHQQLTGQLEAARKQAAAQSNRYAEEITTLKNALRQVTITNMALKNSKQHSTSTALVVEKNKELKQLTRELAVVQDNNQQLHAQLSQIKPKQCRQPNFNITIQQNVRLWADRVESFLLQLNLELPQREAIYAHLCARSRVVFTQAEVSALQSEVQAKKDQFRHEGAMQFVQLLGDHWQTSKFVTLRVDKGISLRKQFAIRNQLVCQKNIETGRYELLAFEIGGKKVQMVDFVSKYLQKKWMNMQAEKFGVQQLPGVKGAAADFLLIIQEMIKQMLAAGDVIRTDDGLRSKDGRKLVCIWSLDGSLGFKGQKLVNFTFRLLPTVGATHAVKNVQLFLIYEGGDHNRAVLHNCKEILPKLNKFIKEEQIEVDGCKCGIGNRFCADIPALQSNYGLCGGTCDYTCPWCTCPRADHFKKKWYPRRTMEQTRLLAHRAEGTCPGCGLVIVSATEWAQKVKARQTAGFCKIAESGDDVPNQLLSAVKQMHPDLSFLQVHKGVTYGSDIAVEIEFDQAAACIMHMNGCLVGMLFKGSVLTTLSNYHSKKGKDKESLCMQLVVFLNGLGFNINKLQPADSNVGTWFHSLSKHTPAGRDTSILLECFDRVLSEFVFPKEVRDADVDAREKYERWVEVWEFYRDHIWKPLCDFSIERTEKAKLIKQNSGKFIDLYLAAYVATGHLYPHVLSEHIEEMILDSDADLWEKQLQANEHMNKWVKSRQRDTTNKQKESKTIDVSPSERVYFTPDNQPVSKTVAGHKRKTGTVRTEQILTLAVARNSLSVDLFDSDLTLEQSKKVQTAKKAADKALLLRKLNGVT